MTNWFKPFCFETQNVRGYGLNMDMIVILATLYGGACQSTTLVQI